MEMCSAYVYSKNSECLACFIIITCMINNINKVVLLTARCRRALQSKQGPGAQAVTQVERWTWKGGMHWNQTLRCRDENLMITFCGGNTQTTGGNINSVRENRGTLRWEYLDFRWKYSFNKREKDISDQFQLSSISSLEGSSVFGLCVLYHILNLFHCRYIKVYGGYIFLVCF